MINIFVCFEEDVLFDITVTLITIIVS